MPEIFNLPKRAVKIPQTTFLLEASSNQNCLLLVLYMYMYIGELKEMLTGWCLSEKRDKTQYQALCFPFGPFRSARAF